MGKPLRTLGLSIALLATLRLEAQPSGFAGPEIVVNTTTASDQTRPRVSYAGPGFVVVWESGGNIQGQRFSALGQALGSQFRVNSYTTAVQSRPDASGFGVSGEFVLVWASEEQDGDSVGIYAQRYSGAGVPEGGEFRVNTVTTGAQYGPTVSASGGAFFVAWTSAQEGFGNGIYAQRYFAVGGAPASGELHVNSYTTGFQVAPAVANDPNNNFTVVFQGDGTPEDGDLFGVFGQRYANTGAKTGGEFRSNTSTTGSQNHPAIVQQNNTVTVVWETLGAGSLRDIHAQRYQGEFGASPGAPLGVEFRVNTTTSVPSTYPRVGSDASTEQFIVVWESEHDGDGSGIFAQKYLLSGAAQGAEFRVNSYTTSDQTHPDVVGQRDFIVTWESQGQDGSGNSVVVRRYCLLLSGDANSDGSIDVLDVFYVVNNLFAGGPAPIKNSDVNDDGALDVLDVFYLVNYLFAGGPGPACI